MWSVLTFILVNMFMDSLKCVVVLVHSIYAFIWGSCVMKTLSTLSSLLIFSATLVECDFTLFIPFFDAED